MPDIKTAAWSTRYAYFAPTLRRLLVVFAIAWALAAPAPLAAQGITIERWVDAANGDDGENCTRIVEEGENDGDPDIYTYKSCATIQRALAVANPGDVIRVAHGAYAGPVTINKQITIVGGYPSGFGPYIDPPTSPVYYATISGASASVPVQITAGIIPTPTTISLEGLIVTGGNGGGVRVQGLGFPLEVTLENLEIFSNGNAGNGGGVSVTGVNTKLIVKSSTIRNNTATGGGGVYVGGSAQLELSEDSVIHNNSAGSGNGGGLAASGALTVTLGGITLTSNTAGQGGGLYVSGSLVNVGADTVIDGNTATNGGGVYLTGSNATLNSAILRGNTGTSNGGGVYITGGSPVLDSLNVTLNQAPNGGGLYATDSAFRLGNSSFLTNTATSGNGGGFYITGGSGMTVTGTSAKANKALSGSGGGFVTGAANLTIQGATFEGNAAANGAGLYVQNGQGRLSGNVHTGNIASSSGGGLYFTGSADLVVSGLTLSENNAIGSGGGLYATGSTGVRFGSPGVIDNLSGGQGAGLYAVNSTLVITGSALLQGNTATGQGGGAYLATGSVVSFENLDLIDNAGSDGGGVYTGGGRLSVSRAASFLDNQATSGNGGALYLTSASSGTSSLRDLFAQNNKAVNGGAFYATGATFTFGDLELQGNEATTGSGGGGYLDAAAITVTLNAIASNRAVDGGGVYVAGSGRSAIVANTVISNTADRNGGGFYLNGSNAELQANTVRANRTGQGRGGGLYATNGVATLSGNLFDANVAPLAGGGLYLHQDGSSISDDTVQGNQAGDGGGVYLDGPATGAAQPAPLLNKLVVRNNIANNHGGGVFFQSSAATLNRTVVSGNQAAAHGGGVYLKTSRPTAFTGNVVTGNQAADLGGGLYLGPGTTGRFASNVVADNQAADGGGIYAAGASPVLVHTTLARNGRGLVAAPQDGAAATVVLSNTIVAGHTVGVQANTDATISLFTTLWDGNITDLVGPGGVGSTGDIAGAAKFTADGYHLLSGSDAVGKGLTGDAATGSDLDGENRFQGSGPELGADELPSPCAAIVGESPAPVYATVQDAIDAAPAGGEVRVAGTCTGVLSRNDGLQQAVIAKNLTLRGGYSTSDWQTARPTAQPTVLDAAGGGRVLVVSGDVRVTLSGLTLINGDATGQGDGPGGADAGGNLLVNATRVALDQVILVSGAAAVGGGFYLKADTATVADSEFRDNQASGSGGGLYLNAAGENVQLRGNRFTGNSAQDGGGLYAAGGAPLLLANDFDGNTANLGLGRGGGAYLGGGTPQFNRNRLDDNRAADGGGLYVAGGTATVINNIFAANTGVTGGAGLTLADTNIDLRHNTLVANHGGSTSAGLVVVGSGRVVSVTNTILVGHATALAVGAGSRAILRADLWRDNAVNWSGGVTEESSNRFDDPGFVDAAAGNYRLAEDSAAIDRGINAGVADDIDGQSRPGRQGYDIGADEFLNASISATLAALPDPVASGEKITYIAQVINTGDVAVVATIRLSLPSVATPEGPVIWEDVTIARGAVWSVNVVATIATGYAGTLNAELTAEGDTASASAATQSSAADISGAVLVFGGESLPDPVAAGQTVQIAVRLDNQGAVPPNTVVRGQLPPGLIPNDPTTWTPVIAGPGGQWTTKFSATVAPTVTTDLVSTFVVTSVEGISGVYHVTTKLARPAMTVTRVPMPNPARSGATLRYVIAVTNTGNLALDLTIANTFPIQTALANSDDTGDWTVSLPPGEVYRRIVTTTVEAGYTGPLTGGVVVRSDTGLQVAVDDRLEAIDPSLTPTASARGGDWYRAGSWEPAGVPADDDVVLIPAGVVMFTQQPILVGGLINRGGIELRNALGGRQAMTVTGVFQNEGNLRGADATAAGDDGLSVDLTVGILLNQGTICGDNGAEDGGNGGDLVITATGLTNRGLFCGGDGANVGSARVDVPGGNGGDVIIGVDPGLIVNSGEILGGAGGNSHPDADLSQPGGDGGEVTLLSAASALLANSDVRGGSGGQGSSGAATGVTGGVFIAAPEVDATDTCFGDSAVTIVTGNDRLLDFVALGPGVVVWQQDKLVIFAIRIFNRGSLEDTYIVTPLTTPTGWEVNNLPGTVTINPFRSGSLPVALTIPPPVIIQPSAAEEKLTIVVTSQRNASNQAVIQLRFAPLADGALLRLPIVYR